MTRRLSAAPPIALPKLITELSASGRNKEVGEGLYHASENDLPPHSLCRVFCFALVRLASWQGRWLRLLDNTSLDAPTTGFE